MIFVDEPFEKSTALMRASDGTIQTQFDLHDCEAASLIKYDILSIEALDKMQICLGLLSEYKRIPEKSELRELYDESIGVYDLDRTSERMWRMVWNHEIQSLFQMEKQSGIAGIALTHPKSVDDLAALNSAIRLMPQSKNTESPLEKFSRFKANINHWYREMDEYGLTKKEQSILSNVLETSYGLCITQEQFMQLVQIPECGGFDLQFADRLRKSIAKKNASEYEALEKEYFESIKQRGLSEKLCNYVWRVLIAMNRGYGFNASHTLGYSLIALQEMNLAYKYPIIFWNCACLIVNSGNGEDTDSGDKTAKDYNKIARALGDTLKAKIKISMPNVNTSEAIFSPDVENNTIRYGLNGVANIGSDVVQNIIKNRPYESFFDFCAKTNLNKTQIISLIKAGAFDSFGKSRYRVMAEYLWKMGDRKSRITLQNMPGLIKYNLVPKEREYAQSIKIYKFNKGLKSCKKNGIAYILNEEQVQTLQEMGLERMVAGNLLPEPLWKEEYSNATLILKRWMERNHDMLIEELNTRIFMEDWEKYATGTLSSWEMESLSFYYHEHELAKMNAKKYRVKDFYKLPEQPVVENIFIKGNRKIPLFKIERIAGTCIAKDKDKATISLLTTTGVVTVKFRKDFFNYYDKQISEKEKTAKGSKKTVIERSWFSRGTLLLIQGIRRGDEFVAKKYNRTAGHTLYKITQVLDEGDIILTSERKKGIAEDET